MGLLSNYGLRFSCLAFILILCASICSAANKYSEKANDGAEPSASAKDFDRMVENDEKPFRMKKVNLVWTKAKKIISGQKLADLYADLKMHDKEEAVLKKLKVDNSDKDGKKEAEVLENYRYIMEYYGLNDYYQDHFDNEIYASDEETKRVNFQDPKLQAMWKRAERSGFSDQDLLALKEEFWHQQMKLNEFEFMRREVKADKEGPDDENIVDEEAQRKLNLSPEEKKEKMQNLKMHNKNIKEGYMRLEDMTANLPKQELDFKDYRVQKLWALAKKTNWTEEEKEGFKEELKHFEHRLSKQDYYQEQLELTRDALKDQFKDGDEYPEKLLHLKEKTDHVKQKVKKLHSHMKTRLEKALRHTEL